ncbi:MAG: protein kinase [Verrucomicrobia bacterium]|nr:protein kinase [Verrucomicrobiota bacterium]
MTGQPTSKPACPSCGAEVPPDAPQGYCLKCLFALGTAEPETVVDEAGGKKSEVRDQKADARTPPDSSRRPLTSDFRPLAFGDYELLEEIARGGMGIIYRARQKSLGRIVAVKRLLFGDQSGKEQAQRFRAEAALAASLQHPNIVAIHEVSAHEGQPFFVMDFIEGQNLAKLSAECEVRNAEWLRRAARYVKIVAEAIHYAHERGLLHRDLKPSNVLIDPFDQPRVTDFGLAKRLHHDSELTLSGQVLGSPNYMPPEQAAAKRGLVGRRSDVYSLGAILYHLLTGRPPFVGETLTDTLQDVVNKEPVSPRLLNPSVPRDLETLCLKCLEKEPARRYQTAQALADDLDRFLRAEPIHARPVNTAEKFGRWCRRKPALAASFFLISILLLIVIIGSPIAIYHISQARKAEAIERQRAQSEALAARQNLYAADMLLTEKALAEKNLGRAVELLDRHRPTNFSSLTPRPALGVADDLRGWEWRYFWKQAQGEERFILGYHTNGVSAVGVLRDGKTVWSAGFDKAVRLWDLEARQQIGQLNHGEAVFAAAGSPDGRWLATVTSDPIQSEVQSSVRLWDLSTAPPIATVLASNHFPRALMVFSPNSRLVAFMGLTNFCLFDVKARRQIANLLAAPPQNTFPLGFAFSPNARTAAYCEGYSGTIVLWDTESQTVISSLKGHTAAVRALVFSPDGRRLASGADDRTIRIWNLAQQQALVITNQANIINQLVFSPSGRSLAIASLDQQVKFLDADNGEPQRELRGHRGSITCLAFLRDGRSLITGSLDWTVRVWDTTPQETPKTTQQLRPESTGDESRLSPDGQHLLAVFSDGTFSVWDTRRFVESQRQPLPWTNTTAWALAPGGKVAAFGNYTGQATVWDVDTGHGRYSAQVASHRIIELRFSPDGKQLAIGVRTVLVWDVASGRESHRWTNDVFVNSLQFSREGQRLASGFYTGLVKVWDLSNPPRERVFQGHTDQVNGLAFSPDGRILVSVPSAQDIRIWDVDSQQQLSLLSPRPIYFTEGAISPDGRTLAVGDFNGLITLWNMASLQQTGTLDGHREHLYTTGLAFSPDGDTLVSVSKEHFRIWRAASFAEAGSKEAR